MLDVVVEMAAIDMEQIDDPVGELVDRVIERRANECREGGIPAVVISAHVLVDFLPVESGVLVAAPCIHGEATRRELQALDSLAECEIRKSPVRAKLYQRARTERPDEPEREWRVLQPRALWTDLVRWPERSEREAVAPHGHAVSFERRRVLGEGWSHLGFTYLRARSPTTLRSGRNEVCAVRVLVPANPENIDFCAVSLQKLKVVFKALAPMVILGRRV